MCPCFGVPRLSTDKNTISYPDDQSCSQITSLWLFFCFLSRSTKFLELMDNAEKSIEQVRPLFISSKSSVKIWTSSKTKQQTNKRSRPSLLFSLFGGCCGNIVSKFGLQAEKFDLISLVPNIHLIMKKNIQVTADTIYTSKQFQRIKDNFDVSINYDNSYFNITVGHLMASCRILYMEPWKACVSKML